MLATQNVTALLDAILDLHRIRDEARLYSFVLNRASDVLKAQGGTFFSVRPDVGELYPEAAKGVSLSLIREIPFKMKLGLSGWCATERTSVLIENAQVDDRFNRSVDVITGIRTRSVLCVPVASPDRITGVIELVNRVDGVFTEADLEFIEAFARQVVVALDNCRMNKEKVDVSGYIEGALESLPGGFISIDLKGVVTRCNATACRLLALVSEDVVGKPLAKGFARYPALAAILDVAQKHQTHVGRQEVEVEGPDGQPMMIGYSTFPIRGDARSLGAAMTFQNLSHLKRR